MTARGYTLVEMVAVITILSIVGMASSLVVLESMRVYARTVPALDATYEARLASQRFKMDLRDMQEGSITTFSPAALSFQLSGGQSISYGLSGPNLLRNGDLLARGVSSFGITYWKSDGTGATTAAEVHLVEIDLTVQSAGQTFRIQSAVFPRSLGT